ncbi:MAG: hypothetical protein LBB56_02570 [Chitinispirillales bacterium]|jgi:hypothetical protein|nr:hypothetical protein [Chitinispirillales bacterium]
MPDIESAEDIRKKFSAPPPAVSPVPAQQPVPTVDRQEVYENEGKRRAKERREHNEAQSMPYNTQLATTYDAYLRFTAKKTELKRHKCNLTIQDVFLLGLELLDKMGEDGLKDFALAKEKKKSK